MYILSKRDSEAERYIMKLEEAKMHKINRVMFYFEKGDFSFLRFISFYFFACVATDRLPSV